MTQNLKNKEKVTLKWRKCFKVDCSPAIEVFSNFVRVYNINYDSIEALDKAINFHTERSELLQQVKAVWLEEFKQ